LRSSPKQEASQSFREPAAARLAPEREADNEQAQRTAIVGQLAGGILHDFNNVLMVITGTIEILADGVADRPQLAAIARLIDEAATRGARLATHLLAFARGQPSGRDEVDVNALLAEAAGLLRPTFGGQIEVAFRPTDDLPAVLADPSQLLAAVLSVGIAIRNVMPEGGTLTLRAHSSQAAVTIGAHAVDQARTDMHTAAQPIEFGFVESLVRRSGGELLPSRSEVGTLVEIVLPRAIS
jgi:nitrogen-specific signal transduction histidine kinase